VLLAASNNVFVADVTAFAILLENHKNQINFVTQKTINPIKRV